ncbi:Kinesin motor domain [Trypanosoma vivax]|uniref:Putative kinesin n=1 Tax=Trypanosoma vivax (strain Y486) TaxID=1055687 RepID=G0TT10_TRYVY|nr:Kinesin motor domain [Trypanosoma vivax]CCC47091.1 putative kinesin [Trypanosoma vivax Y486]
MTEVTKTCDRVQVGVRIFPARQGDKVVVRSDPDDNQCVLVDEEGGRGTTALKFDRVLTGSQEEVYDFIGRPMLREAFEGFNVCLFAYGQTGSGKTHSLFGDMMDKHNSGIAPRFAQEMIEEAQRRMEADSRVTIKFCLSMVEVYMEKVRDLLAPRVRGQEPESLEILEDNQRRVYVKGAGVHPVLSVERLMGLLQLGNANRQKGETRMNETSSRSHAIIQITISQQYDSLDMKDVESVALLVDLAGSERQSKTESSGLAFEEAKKINQSLLMLGRALNSFSDRKGNDGFISLRASKLTRLLSESFGGNSKTWMLATVSPTAYNLTETKSTLEYAQNATAIKNKAKVNKTAKKADVELNSFKDFASLLEGKLGNLTRTLKEKKSLLEKLIWERDTLRKCLSRPGVNTYTDEKLIKVLNKVESGNAALQQHIDMLSEEHTNLSGRSSGPAFFKGKCAVSGTSVMFGQRCSLLVTLLNGKGEPTDTKLQLQLFSCPPHHSLREDPLSLVGEDICICLRVVGAVGLPENCCQNAFCRVTLMFDPEERSFTTSAAKGAPNVVWDLVKLFQIPNITEEIIRCFCERPIFTFEVFSFAT